LTAHRALDSLAIAELQKQFTMREWLKKIWRRRTGKLKVLLKEKDYISSPIDMAMVSLLSPVVRGKELRCEKTNFSATLLLSNIDTIHFAKKYIPHFRGVLMRDLLPKAPKSRECGIVILDNSRSIGTH